MSLSPSFDSEQLDILEHWIRERESVRRAKEAGLPKPWTNDPLLRDYRWCNVRRMDDRVSVALLERWYTPDADPTTALVAACLARLVNWPESLMAVTMREPFALKDLAHAERRLHERARGGYKVFTGAYVVPGEPGESKITTVMRRAQQVLAAAGDVYQPTMRATWARLTALDGIGSFLAGQMVADIAHLQAGEGWPDRETWAPVGPGSARGINRLCGRPKEKTVSQDQFELELPVLVEVLRPRVSEIWNDRQLVAMDVQNCLCEHDKYRRLTLGEGTVRASYDGLGPAQGTLL